MYSYLLDLFQSSIMIMDFLPPLEKTELTACFLIECRSVISMIINKSLFLFASQVNIKAQVGDINMLNMDFFFIK